MKIGVIYVAYGCKDYVDKSLSPWLELREKRKDLDISICAISFPFENFQAQDDGTVDLLKSYVGTKINKLYSGNSAIKETAARTLALHLFKKENRDISFQWDADEFATVEQLEAILKRVEKNPFDVWFRISYKNYVFSTNSYLATPFQPARIHRLKTNTGFIAKEFWDDNNISYEMGNNVMRDIDAFPCGIIGQNVAWIRHYTWLNNERSKKKVEYQKARGWTCSYEWDYNENKLKFNAEYYKKEKLPFPHVFIETT